MVADLTGLPIAERLACSTRRTAAAEAMTLARRASQGRAAASFVVDADALPQTIAVIATRAEPLGIEVRRRRPDADGLPDGEFFGAAAAVPGRLRRGARPRGRSSRPRTSAGALVTVAADLLALTPAARRPASSAPTSPSARTQRFGVPLGFGGPHAGYLAVRAGLERIAARPAGRRVRRRRRRPGLPARAADPRAAHPPGEGDQQHLHRAGAARRDGRHVRGLPRAGRAARRSPRRTHRHAAVAGRRAARRRRRGRARRRSSTP